MRSLCLGLVAVALTIMAFASGAQAQDRTHDGFMLRFTGGAGYGTASEEVGNAAGGLYSKWTMSGGGIMFSADVGGSPIENLVLHGRFGAMVVSKPDVEFEGGDFDIEGSLRDEDSSLTFVLLGPAVTYYIMPANIYLTGAIGLGVIGIRVDEDRSGGTDVGWALNFDAGWEFWVGPSWAMGPAIRLFYTSAPDGDANDVTDADLTVKGGGGGVLFSATFQ
jgi:hypothetical protein